MFTGIVEEIGTVGGLQRRGAGYDLSIDCELVTQGTQLGDSINVNGVCLTVTDLSGAGFTVGLSPETRRRTNLIHLTSGGAVNLERSVTPTTRLGGHFVQGHIDGTGTVTGLRREADALWVRVEAAPDLMRYIVPKGYIALDGTSLTVVDVGDSWFTVQLVAYTQQEITLSDQRAGYVINIEVDVLGKYVEKMLGLNQGSITHDFLTEHGFGSSS